MYVCVLKIAQKATGNVKPGLYRLFFVALPGNSHATSNLFQAELGKVAHLYEQFSRKLLTKLFFLEEK